MADITAAVCDTGGTAPPEDETRPIDGFPGIQGQQRRNTNESGLIRMDSQGIGRQAGRNYMSKPQAQLRVKWQTWHKDSHELFDYESSHIHTGTTYAPGPCRFFRHGLTVFCLGEGCGIPEAADHLLSIRKQPDGQFVICPAKKTIDDDPDSCAKKLWIIVRDLPVHKYPLRENDIIKLGRFKLRVRQLCRIGDAASEIRLEDIGPQLEYHTSEMIDGALCRFCLHEGGDIVDPLITPCDCKGSIKHVHVECLKYWINGRLNITQHNEQRHAYFLKHVQCELCKAPFPTTMKYMDDCMQLLKVPQIDPPFIVLENLKLYRGIHIISMAEKKDLKIGRGHESDVRIPDVSISRHHATVRYMNGQFLLEDHNSKFGTLVALKRPHAITDSGIGVQAGRSILAFTLDETTNGVKESKSEPGIEIKNSCENLLDHFSLLQSNYPPRDSISQANGDNAGNGNNSPPSSAQANINSSATRIGTQRNNARCFIQNCLAMEIPRIRAMAHNNQSFAHAVQDILEETNQSNILDVSNQILSSQSEEKLKRSAENNQSWISNGAHAIADKAAESFRKDNFKKDDESV